MEGNCTHHLTFLLKLSARRRRTTPQIGCFPGVVAPVEQSGGDPMEQSGGDPMEQSGGDPWSKVEPTPRSKVEATRWEQSGGDPWSEVEARRRRSRAGERPYPAKQDGPASAEQAWNKARRRRGAWHGDAVERSGRRIGAPQRIASMQSQHADATRTRRPLCTLDKTARARLIRREVSKASRLDAFSRS